MSTDQRINDSAFREWMSDVPCSVCGAGVGDGCKGGTGQIHLARALAAQEVAAKSDDHLRHGPWRWDDNRPEAGLWCEIGHPLICDYNLGMWEIEPVVVAATSACSGTDARPQKKRRPRSLAGALRFRVRQ